MERTQSLAESIRESRDDSQDFRAAWDSVEAAGDFSPLPAGKYLATATSGELGATRNGTSRYRVEFTISDGEHAGRRLPLDIYLSTAALALAKRDLAKLGIERPDQMDRPLRPVRVQLRVALRVEDDGTEYNRIRSFERLQHSVSTPKPRTEDREVSLVPADEELAAFLDDVFFPHSEENENE